MSKRREPHLVQMLERLRSQLRREGHCGPEDMVQGNPPDDSIVLLDRVIDLARNTRAQK